MSNDYFRFKEFTVHQGRSAMKVCTDACLFGAWTVRHLQHAKHVLDIGTGTGLLSLMIAQKTSVSVDAIEYDHESFIQAKENITAGSSPNRILIIEGDVRHFTFTRNYDIVITNPRFLNRISSHPKKIRILRGIVYHSIFRN